MINIEDLRIGDLVQVGKDCTFPKGTLCIVTDIHSDGIVNEKKGIVGLRAANCDNDGPEIWCCNCNVEGVPITPEMLRNNGFKEEVGGKCYTMPIADRAENYFVRYLAVERGKYVWPVFIKYYNVKGYALLRKIKYVHELQHIFMIVKINPEMKV